MFCYVCSQAVQALYLRAGGVLNCRRCTALTARDFKDYCIAAYGV